jgi:hypothetical protein
MAIEVELFDGTVLEFPDGTDPGVIDRVAKSETQARQAPAQGGAKPGPWTKYQQAGPGADRAPAEAKSGPWVKYQQTAQTPDPARPQGPWTKYQDQASSVPAGPDPRFQTPFVSPANHEVTAGVPIPIPPVGQRGAPSAPRAAQPGGGASGVDGWLLDVAASAADGIREGFTALPDAAIHAVDQAPRVLNLPKMIPGMEDAYGDVGTVTEGGQAFLNWALGNGDFAVPEGADSRPTTLRDVTGGFGAFDHVPQTGAGRFANRVGQEIGASALPAGAAMAYGGRFVPAAGGPAVAHEGVRQLVEPFVRNPGAALSREMAGATAAGVGAATANATHEAITGGQGGTWWTDFVGGLGGLGVAGAVEGLARTGADIYRRVSNDPRYQQKIAGEAVADRLIDNSTVMQGEHFAGRPLDAQVLAQRLDQPTALEDLVPGYRAGTADRSGDSRLRSLAYNTEALAPGAANVRRERNMGAVGDFIRGLVPDGDGAAFLDGVRTAAAGIVDDATTAATAARGRLDDALEAVRPRMQPIDRGQQIRDDLTAVFDERTADYRRAYDARDAAMAGDRIDAAAPYRALQDEADRLTTYERNAYVPGDIMSSARELAPDGAPPAEATGLLDMFGNPVMRAPADPRQTDIPLSEALALRHGLTTRQREALAAGRAPEHRALSRLSEGLRSTIDDAMSPETRALDAQARELRRGVAADFEDGNLPSRILDTTGRGRDRMPAEAVGPRVTAGETPYRDTMRLAGARDGTRAAVRDQVLG